MNIIKQFFGAKNCIQALYDVYWKITFEVHFLPLFPQKETLLYPLEKPRNFLALFVFSDITGAQRVTGGKNATPRATRRKNIYIASLKSLQLS